MEKAPETGLFLFSYHKRKSHCCIKNPCFLLLLFLLQAQNKEAKKRALAIRRKFRLRRTTADVNTGAQADPSFPSPLFLRIALSIRLQCHKACNMIKFVSFFAPALKGVERNEFIEDENSIHKGVN
jgi:hypothetical protein